MQILVWIAFLILILLLLVADLGIFHKNSREIHPREALIWTGIWISISMIFNIAIYFIYENHWMDVGLAIGMDTPGKDAALKFFTGYLLEKSLSIDNLFIMAIVFAFFKIPGKYQHEILFWGILGALIFRGILIIGGAVLINTFSWISYIFGGLLIISAVKMLTSSTDNVDPYKNPAFNILKKIYPFTSEIHDDKFFIRENGIKMATPLLVVLVVIETTDIMFAVDSIPAIFAVTTDAFIVFTSNVFAILGLRSLYFVLASYMDKFRYLKVSLVFVLAFVGTKMLLLHYYKFPTLISLSVIVGIIAVGVLASIYAGSRPSSALAPLEVLNKAKDENNNPPE
jgi:tellurite resistance protein TerC